jgi:hypothetical protein
MEDWRERGRLQPASTDRPHATSPTTEMKANSRSVKQKAAAAIAMLLVLGGGAIAAVSATGADRHKGADRPRHSPAGIRHRDLPAVASYLGLSPAQLEAELRSGRSLAQIAESTPGKSVAGLIDALIAHKRERLSKLAATLPRRVRAEVDRQGGLAGRHGARRAGGPRGLAHRGLGAAAAAYLGISVHQLRTQLRAGRTLAQIAGATPGRSPAGLIDALTAAKKRRIAARAAAGRLTSSQADRANGRAEKLITKIVNRRLHPRHQRLIRR